MRHTHLCLTRGAPRGTGYFLKKDKGSISITASTVRGTELSLCSWGRNVRPHRDSEAPSIPDGLDEPFSDNRGDAWNKSRNDIKSMLMRNANT